ADVAGYVQPGSQIVVFDTIKLLGPHKESGENSQGGATDNWFTKVLLPRVEVLAVSAAAPARTNVGTDGGGQLLVTVAADQLEAQRLIHENTHGNLYLGLLSESSKTSTGSSVDNFGTENPVFPDWAHAS